MVPVWDLAPDTEAAEVEEPAAAFADRLDAALAESKPLDGAQRRALAELQEPAAHPALIDGISSSPARVPRTARVGLRCVATARRS